MLNKDLVNPKNTVILVIDIQNDYCSEKGKIAKFRKFDMRPVQKIVPKILKFVDFARNKGLPIIWTRMIEDPRYLPPNYSYKIKHTPIPISACTPGTFGFDYYKIKPVRGDFQIVKRAYDAFDKPKLQKVLKSKKIKNLIIVGAYTSVCVDTSVRSGFRLGYNIIVPEDLVAMPKQRWHLHKAALENMGTIFAFVVDSKEIVNVWKV